MSEKKVFIKRRMKRRKACFYCVEKLNRLDYKNVGLFKKFITERGKIVPKRNSGICAKHQRMLAEAVKRARYIGFIAYCMD